jgi:hypothetical protein
LYPIVISCSPDSKETIVFHQPTQAKPEFKKKPAHINPAQPIGLIISIPDPPGKRRAKTLAPELPAQTCGI